MTEEQKKALSYPNKKLDKDWIVKGITQEAVIWAESFGKYLTPKGLKEGEKVDPLTTSQLRRFFGNLKKIEADNTFSEVIPQTDIIMLIPQLAYAVGRAKNREKDRIGDFYQQAKLAIEAIPSANNREAFKNFVKLFEAIVAYHKFYGGQDSSNK